MSLPITLYSHVGCSHAPLRSCSYPHMGRAQSTATCMHFRGLNMCAHACPCSRLVSAHSPLRIITIAHFASMCGRSRCSLLPAGLPSLPWWQHLAGTFLQCFANSVCIHPPSHCYCHVRLHMPPFHALGTPDLPGNDGTPALLWG